jgi:cold shock CspA family protein
LSSHHDGRFFFSSTPDHNILANTTRSTATTTTTTAITRSSSSSTSSDDGEYVTGRVKLYFRKKAYGFLLPDRPGGEEDNGTTNGNTHQNNDDDDNNNDAEDSNFDRTADNADGSIFVHQTDIQSAKYLDPSKRTLGGVQNPYLIRQERVRFRIVEQINDAKDFTFEKRAKDVTYEDGSPIPIYRSEYVNNVKKYNYSVLGETVYEAMEMEEEGEDDDEYDHDDEKDRKGGRATKIRRSTYEKIKATYEEVNENIADGQARYDAMNELVQKDSSIYKIPSP